LLCVEIADADCREKSPSVSALITIMSTNMGLTHTVMNMNMSMSMVPACIMAKSTRMLIRIRTAILIRIHMSTGTRMTTSTAIPTAGRWNCVSRFWQRTNAWRSAIAVSFMHADC